MGNGIVLKRGLKSKSDPGRIIFLWSSTSSSFSKEKKRKASSKLNNDSLSSLSHMEKSAIVLTWTNELIHKGKSMTPLIHVIGKSALVFLSSLTHSLTHMSTLQLIKNKKP